MAQKNKPTIIIKKYVGMNGKRYVGEVLKYSPNYFGIIVSELKETTERKEVSEPVQSRQRIEKLRPLNIKNELLPKELLKRQGEIDMYLLESTIGEALELIDGKNEEGKKEPMRRIEVALKFRVERWQDERITTENVPVERDVTEVTKVKLDELPMYIRPQGNMVQQIIKNYIITEA